MKTYGVLIAAAVLFTACSSNGVKVNGRFAGCSNDHKVYLEKILPGVQQIVDSTELDKKCSFRFKIKIADKQPTLYNLRYENEIIPLMLAPGEKVTVNSMCNLSHNYTVAGSHDSERIREITSLLNDGALRLDTLRRALYAAEEADMQDIYKAYQKEYNRIKRAQLAFIVSEPSSLSSLYALYQRLPGNDFLFNQDNDFIYYRQVADSTEKYYPESPYVISLRREVEASENSMKIIDLINQGVQQDFPDLSVPDIYGNKQMLSANKGKVILVDFWLSNIGMARSNNAEMKKLYEKFAPQGFEIYQVSADTHKAEWVDVVQTQKLPWITVCDFKGDDSPALRAYNISSLPTNFLIDRNGTIVAKELYGDKLAQKVEELL